MSNEIEGTKELDELKRETLALITKKKMLEHYAKSIDNFIKEANPENKELTREMNEKINAYIKKTLNKKDETLKQIEKIIANKSWKEHELELMEDGLLQEKEVEEVESVAVRYPNLFLITTDLLSRELPFQKLDKINIKLSRNSNKAVTGNMVIEPAFENELTKQLPALTPEHFLYLKGICRLYDAGIKIFTPDMIYRFSVGDSKAEVRPDKRKRVASHIDDMRRMIPNINITELMKQYHKIDKQGEKPVFISDNLLYLKEVFTYVQGVKRSAYKIIEAPILLQLASSLGQVGAFEWALLETKGNSVDDGLIKNYLAQRVVGMENAKNSLRSKRILLDSIYKHIGKENPSDKQARTIKKKVTDILEYWKQENRIKDFAEVKEGRKIRGYDLEVFYKPKTKHKKL